MKILLAIDGSPHSRAAAALVEQIPWPSDTECTVVQVVEGRASLHSESWAHAPDEETLQEIDRRAREEAGTAVSDAANSLLATGLTVRTQVLEGGSPQQEILSYADELDVDLVVIGKRGRGDRKRFALGRVARALVRDCTRSMLVVRPRKDAEATPHERLRVLIALDESESSQAAVDEIATLPLGDRVSITLLTILTVGTTLFEKDILERLSEEWKAYKAAAQLRLEETGKELREICDQVEPHLVDGGTDPSDEILTAAEVLGADLLVAGHTRQSRLDRLLQVSVSTELVEQAPCSIWLSGLK